MLWVCGVRRGSATVGIDHNMLGSQHADTPRCSSSGCDETGAGRTKVPDGRLPLLAVCGTLLMVALAGVIWPVAGVLYAALWAANSALESVSRP